MLLKPRFVPLADCIVYLTLVFEHFLNLLAVATEELENAVSLSLLRRTPREEWHCALRIELRKLRRHVLILEAAYRPVLVMHVGHNADDLEGACRCIVRVPIQGQWRQSPIILMASEF